MYSAKNSLKVFVSNKANFATIGTTLKTLPIGEIGFFSETGALVGSSVAVLGPSGIGTGFFAWRKADGQVERGKTFTFTGWAANRKQYAAPTLERQTVTVPTATVGEPYQLRIEMFLPGMQGNYYKHGNYVAVTGDTTTTIATALCASMNAAMAREKKDYFTVSNSNSATITIVTKLLPYVRGKKQGRPAWFRASLTLPEAISVIGTQTVAPSDGIGYAPYLAEKEFFAQGDSDELRFGGYPNSFDDKALVTSLTGQYDLYAITVDDVVKTANNDVRAPQQYLIALNTIGATAIPIVDPQINNATTITGKSVPGATVDVYVNGTYHSSVTANSTTGVWTETHTVSTNDVLTATALLAPGTVSATSVAVTVTAS